MARIMDRCGGGGEPVVWSSSEKRQLCHSQLVKRLFKMSGGSFIITLLYPY